MKTRVEGFLAVACAAVAFGAVVYFDPMPVTVVVSVVLIVATVLERRSLVWVLLAGALMFVAPIATLAAVALAPPGAQYDLAQQGLAALRRCLAAALSPVLALGGAFGALRLGRSKQALWWMIAWVPATLVAAMGGAFFHTISATLSTAIVATVGVLMSFDKPAPGAAALRSPADPLVAAPAVSEPGRESVDQSRTIVAQGGGTNDWADVISAIQALSGRRARAKIEVPADARGLDPAFNDPAFEVTKLGGVAIVTRVLRGLGQQSPTSAKGE